MRTQLDSELCVLYTDKVRSMTEQLNDAFERSGLTVVELLKRSGLDIDRSSLARKLKGELRLNVDEAQTLAAVLGVTLVWIAEGAA